MRARIAMLLAASLLAGGARAAAPVAEILTLEGSATAAGRELRAGDTLESGSVVSTAAGSRAALFAGEIYVQLDPESALRIERDAGNHIRLALEAGRVRIVDTRGGGERAGIAAGGARADISGGDKEVYLLSEKTGRYAMFCEWTGPLTVTRDPKTLTVDPGDCILVKPGEAPYQARGHEHQIPLLPGPDGAPGDAIAQHFNTPDVAAGPFHGFPGPYDVPDRERDPCDIPGSGCEGGLRIVEPPPDPDFCAPGVICDGALGIVEPAPDTSFCAPGVSCPD